MQAKSGLEFWAQRKWVALGAQPRTRPGQSPRVWEPLPSPQQVAAKTVAPGPPPSGHSVRTSASSVVAIEFSLDGNT